ncbi:MAG: hypothetical protein ABSC21_11485 [Terriglobia bacterium]
MAKASFAKDVGRRAPMLRVGMTGLAQSAALRPTDKTEIRRADQSQKAGVAIGAAGQEVQVSGRKMAFVGGHDQR